MLFVELGRRLFRSARMLAELRKANPLGQTNQGSGHAGGRHIGKTLLPRPVEAIPSSLRGTISQFFAARWDAMPSPVIADVVRHADGGLLHAQQVVHHHGSAKSKQRGLGIGQRIRRVQLANRWRFLQRRQLGPLGVEDYSSAMVLAGITQEASSAWISVSPSRGLVRLDRISAERVFASVVGDDRFLYRETICPISPSVQCSSARPSGCQGSWPCCRIRKWALFRTIPPRKPRVQKEHVGDPQPCRGCRRSGARVPCRDIDST